MAKEQENKNKEKTAVKKGVVTKQDKDVAAVVVGLEDETIQRGEHEDGSPQTDTDDVIEMMKKQIEELAAKLTEQPKTVQYQDSAVRKVKVVSMMPYNVNLCPNPNGRGRIYQFTKMGQQRKIDYNKLSECYNSCEFLFTQGYLYVLDKDFITEHGLDDIYEALPTPTNFEEILPLDNERCVEDFKFLTKPLQESVVLSLINRVADGETINLNLLSQIEEISGAKIQEAAQDIKMQREKTKEVENENK